MSGLQPQAWTLRRMSAAIRARDISPVEVTQACLDRIEECASVNAFITILRKPALAAARTAEREILNGRYRGPLHGIPYGAKDLFLTKGVRTTCGSRVLSAFVPTESAALIERLGEAGAVLLGKLNMHEFAFGVTSDNPHYGAVRNPRDPARIAGGSSGGSAAAVAASMVMFALGTDTGGSIRIPSALCGIAGFKPTYGRLSRQGIYPLGWTLDHPGPMAKTAGDLAIVMRVLDGGDRPVPARSRTGALAPAGRGLDGVRIGVPTAYFFERLEPTVALHVRQSLALLRRLGATIVPVSIPLLREGAIAASICLFAEAAASLEKWHRTRASDLGADIRARLDLGASLPATHYLRALRVRAKVRDAFARAFRHVDALVTPQVPVVAPLLGQREVRVGGRLEAVPDALTRLTRIFNLAGIPALSVCCGHSKEGMPIGLQIAAAAHRDAMPLRIGHAYEEASRVARTATKRKSA